MLPLFLTLVVLGQDALAEDAVVDTPSQVEAVDASVPDPTASPITVPLSPDNPGPFTCQVDPFFVMQQGETGQLSIRLRVGAPEHLLYVDRIAVEVSDPAGMEIGELSLPEGQAHTDAWGGPPRQVYGQDTELTLAMVAPPSVEGRVDMQLEVFWQGCSGDMCFMPASQTFNVPVRVKASR